MTTVDGLDAGGARRPRARSSPPAARSAGSAPRGSSCGSRPREAKGRPGGSISTVALAAHLCRCTGWQTVYDAIEVADGDASARRRADPSAAARAGRARGRVPQLVGPDVPLGDGGFADDGAHATRWSRSPARPERRAGVGRGRGDHVGGRRLLLEARALAGKVQGRRTTVDPRAAARAPRLPVRRRAPRDRLGRARRTSSPTRRGARPAASRRRRSPTAARSAARSIAGAARGTRAGRSHRPHRARRCSPRRRRPPRPEAAAGRGDCVVDGDVCTSAGSSSATRSVRRTDRVALRASTSVGEWTSVTAPGPPTSSTSPRGRPRRARRAARGRARRRRRRSRALVRDDRAASVLLDSCVGGRERRARRRAGRPSTTGTIERVTVRVAAGDPLDEVVLRSYAIGAAHMALGWVLTEGLAVDPETGEVHDLTIRSFGILAPRTRHRSRWRSSTTPARRVRVRPTRCSPRSRPRRGTRSATPTARDPSRSPPHDPRRGCATSLTPARRRRTRRLGTSSRSARWSTA